MQQLRYFEDTDTGLIVSAYGHHSQADYAWPVLDFAGIGQGGDGYERGDFRGPMRYPLERIPGRDVLGQGFHRGLRGIKHVDLADKNAHRTFWGLAPLTEAASQKRYVVRVPGRDACIVTAEHRPVAVAVVCTWLGTQRLPRGTTIARDWANTAAYPRLVVTT